MMTQGERIKYLRKEVLHLTLDKFGDKLGVTKMTISRLENEVNNLTDQMCKSICREFNVSEAWLRDGSGDMFIPRTRNQIIGDFLNSVMEDNDNSFRKAFIEALSKLDEPEWLVLEKIADEIAANKKRAE